MSEGKESEFSEIFVTSQTFLEVENMNTIDQFDFKVKMLTQCGLIPISPSLGIFFGPPTEPRFTSLSQV